MKIDKQLKPFGKHEAYNASEILWYCPQLDELAVFTWTDGETFIDEVGPMKLAYKLSGNDDYSVRAYYLVGYCS